VDPQNLDGLVDMESDLNTSVVPKTLGSKPHQHPKRWTPWVQGSLLISPFHLWRAQIDLSVEFRPGMHSLERSWPCGCPRPALCVMGCWGPQLLAPGRACSHPHSSVLAQPPLAVQSSQASEPPVGVNLPG
jgi:hypothetical protein